MVFALMNGLAHARLIDGYESLAAGEVPRRLPIEHFTAVLAEILLGDERAQPPSSSDHEFDTAMSLFTV